LIYGDGRRGNPPRRPHPALFSKQAASRCIGGIPARLLLPGGLKDLAIPHAVR